MLYSVPISALEESSGTRWIVGTIAAIGSLIEDLHDAADNLSIQNYCLDDRMDCDGNLDIALSFGTEADIVLFKIRVS